MAICPEAAKIEPRFCAETVLAEGCYWRKTCEIAAQRQFRGVDSRAATKKPKGTH
jgi:hypothetical protein